MSGYELKRWLARNSSPPSHLVVPLQGTGNYVVLQVIPPVPFPSLPSRADKVDKRKVLKLTITPSLQFHSSSATFRRSANLFALPTNELLSMGNIPFPRDDFISR